MVEKDNDRRPVSAILTIPDPDNPGVGNHAEIGGLLELRSESFNHPDFHVIFSGADPSGRAEGHVYKGSIHQPVVIPLRNEGDFAYTVLQFPAGGSEPRRWENKSRVQPCPGCKRGSLGPPGK